MHCPRTLPQAKMRGKKGMKRCVFHMLIRKMCLVLQRDLAQFTGRKNEESSALSLFTSLPTSVSQWSRNLGFPLIMRAGRFFLSWTPKDTIDGIEVGYMLEVTKRAQCAELREWKANVRNSRSKSVGSFVNAMGQQPGAVKQRWLQFFLL